MASGTRSQQVEIAHTKASSTAPVRSRPAVRSILAVSVLLLLAQMGFFLALSRHRIIDGDEGLYLLAARLVKEHKLPYLDFFYQQMPALPFAYGLWMKFAGATWYAGRALSSIFASIVGTALFAAIWRRTSKPLPAVFALALYLTNADVLGWFVTVKTYALSALFLFAAHQLATSERYRSGVLLGGLALGLATDVRLYCAALLPVFLIWLYRMQKSWRCFGSGFLLALLPNLYFVGISPRTFYFDNLGYHAIRTGHAGLVQDWPQKMQILSGWAHNFQIAVLFLLAGLFSFLYRAGGAAARLALYLSLAFALVCLLPSPAFPQYLSAAVPLLIFAAVVPVSDAMDRLPSANLRVRVAIMFAALLLLSSPVWWRYYPKYFQGIAGMSVANWSVPQVVEVSRAADEFIQPGEPVISTWSGYIFQSLAEPFPGMENECRLNSADLLSEAELRQYRLLDERQIVSAIERGTVRMVIFGHQSAPPGITPEESWYGLLQARFKMVRRIGDTEIWWRQDSVQLPRVKLR